MFSGDLAAAKRLSREHALTVRTGCDPSLGVVAGRHLLAGYPPPAGAVIAGFWPLPGEIDLRPLLHEFAACGHFVVLPVTPKRGEALSFRRWQPGEIMVAERFGTQRPTGEIMVPDFLLVPLLAFDRRGHRLGYGAGYYDRTLAGLPRAIAVGCAFAAQEMDEVPAGPYDVKLHAIATELGVLRCEASPP